MTEEREEILERTLNEYRSQLSVVLTAITVDTTNDDLNVLKANLEEVIALTEVELISVKKDRLLAELCADREVDGVVDGRQCAQTCQSDAHSSASTSTSVSQCDNHSSLVESIKEMNGNQCRAPFAEQNGTVDYHNAIIMINDDYSIEETVDSEVRIKVLFTNPLCDSMRVCEHYMNGKCRYSDDKCRHSHGYYVSFASIKPYEEADYSSLTIDSLCLSKCSADQLWYRAVVDEYRHDSQKFVVKYVNHDIVDTVDIEDLLPLNSDSVFKRTTDSDSSGEDNELGDIETVIAWTGNETTLSSTLGEWERHTKGIGSKLMLKMGYVVGQGLGKRGEGRTQPVEAIVLPTGKSLDICMRLREKNTLRDTRKERTRQMSKKLAIESKIAAGYDRAAKREKTIFDFINNKVSNSVNNDKKQTEKRCLSSTSFKTVNNQSLNVSLLKLAEELRKAEFELSKLLASIERNKVKDRVIVSQLQVKLEKQKHIIKSIKEQEFLIHKEQRLRSNKQKLEIF